MPAARPPSRISMKTEWSLVVFTIASALLVACAAAAAAGRLRLQAWEFMLAALAAVATSALHLGRPVRAWRALLHVRRSWLSREASFFPVFAGLTTAMLAFPGIRTLEVTAVSAGFFTLFCIDRVYGAVSTGIRTMMHSAGSLLTGVFLYGLLIHDARIAGTAGLAKLVSYAFRKNWLDGDLRLRSICRLVFGFVIPLATWNTGWTTAAAAVMMGEFIDRFDFYQDLDISMPERQAQVDLRKQLARRDAF